MDASALNPCAHWCQAIRCHPGLEREVNEDAYLARPDLGVWAVADGMGGHQRGDWASRTIVETLDRLTPAQAGPDGVERALRQAHARILAQGQAHDQTIGSTVVVLVTEPQAATLFWVGDSRLYRWRHGRLERLSKDHSMVQEWIDRGMVRPEEAEGLPGANVITRAVGIGEGLELDRLRLAVEPGDHFLLCSDGLTKELDEAEIATLLHPDTPLEESADRLLQRVLEQGAHDNITFILLRCCQP